MGTGLTFDEYIELTAMPLAGADPVFVQVVEEERERMFPMKLVVAANHLRSRGYDCRPASLELLIRNGIVTPAERESRKRGRRVGDDDQLFVLHWHSPRGVTGDGNF